MSNTDKSKRGQAGNNETGSEVTGEWLAVAAADSPRTRESLANDLRQLGVRPGMTLLVHSSLKSLRWVVEVQRRRYTAAIRERSGTWV